MTEPVLLAYGDRQYTRVDLDALTSGLATILEQRGVRPGDRVALMSSNRPEFVVAMRAIWGLGAAVVLLSSSWKRAEVEHALALTQPSHAVGDNAVLAELMPMLHLDEPVTPCLRDFNTPDPSSDALFVFSSGTTGMPKAVRHTHGGFAAAVAHWRDALSMTSADRMQIMTPPSHILGLLNIATALEAGAWIRLHQRFDVDAMLSHIESDRITIEMAVAPIALALAAHPRLESYDLSSLRYVMWCATPVTRTVADAVTERVGVSWLTAYGASELPVISCNTLEGTRLDTVGRAVPGVRIRIASPETGKPLSPGENGEIQVFSPSAMAGYLPEDETASAFSDGWYRTRHRPSRRRRVAPNHRSLKGNDQGARFPGGAGRDRGRVARPSRRGRLRGLRRPRRGRGRGRCRRRDAFWHRRGRRARRTRRRAVGVVQTAESRGLRPRDSPSPFRKGAEASAKGGRDERLREEQRAPVSGCTKNRGHQ